MASATLKPKNGFNWMAVSWGGPEEVVSEECSYCEAPIPENSCPLIMYNHDGWTARFCRACQESWWGMKTFDPPEDDDDDWDVQQVP